MKMLASSIWGVAAVRAEFASRTGTVHVLEIVDSKLPVGRGGQLGRSEIERITRVLPFGLLQSQVVVADGEDDIWCRF